MGGNRSIFDALKLMRVRTFLLIVAVTVPFIVCSQNSRETPVLREAGYSFTNPLLDCESDLVYIPPFKRDVESLIEKKLQSGDVARASVYFRQLTTGHSFGINENSQYSPASLLKVADLAYMLREAERDPTILSETLLYDQPYATQNSVKGKPTSLSKGKVYTISELLIAMIVHSDNEAVELLERRFGEESMWKTTFENLGIELKIGPDKFNIISPKQYSTIFRVLYNASFLNRDMSGIALDLLCHSKFREGIIAGVADSTILIASKYGLRNGPNGHQFHETAIVYLNKNPYLISIMMEGKETDKLVSLVRSISSIVYEQCSTSSDIEEGIKFQHSTANNDNLLNPLLDCVSELNELEPFRKKVNQYVASQLKKDGLENISVYFQHMLNGMQFGIHQDELYTPASVMKVGLLMNLLREVDQDKTSLDQLVEFDGDETSLEANIKDVQIEPGKSYTVLDLIERTIIYSDNQAYNLLNRSIDNTNKMWLRLFNELGIKKWKRSSDSNEGAISVQNISLFFRVLFNATYLNRENSELALKILSRTRFQKGIRAGLDEGTLAALKFGERTELINDKDVFQLHECGIIYFEDEPYLLCVMTRGTSGFEVLQESIEGVSRLVFEEMKSQFSSTKTEPAKYKN